MKLFNFGIREDYGKEFYFIFFTTKRYSLLQVEFDVSEYGEWIEWPYLQINMGYGRLFSFLFSIGKLGLTFDICGRNWHDKFFYTQPNELKEST